ncbi:MAG: hypothetical protein JWM90_2009 [Thermoleophilia bacterium]|nr:hypothetical protein [Thermoleophilia bacterium]
MAGNSNHNSTWQDAIEEQMSDAERTDAQRTRRWIFWGIVSLLVILVLWIGAVIIGFT